MASLFWKGLSSSATGLLWFCDYQIKMGLNGSTGHFREGGNIPNGEIKGFNQSNYNYNDSLTAKFWVVYTYLARVCWKNIEKQNVYDGAQEWPKVLWSLKCYHKDQDSNEGQRYRQQESPEDKRLYWKLSLQCNVNAIQHGHMHSTPIGRADPQERKGRQGDSPGRHWRRWSLP